MTALFADYLPKTNCPPADANESFEVVYHVVKKPDLADCDFRTAVEANLHHDGDPCQRCSISIFTDLSDVSKFLDFFPYMRRRHLAEGYIPPAAGKIKKLPSQYHRIALGGRTKTLTGKATLR